MKAQARLLDRLSIIAVSSYLIVVGVWLMVTRQIPSLGLGRMLWASVRPAYAGALDISAREKGHCYLADVPRGLLSDSESTSSLRLYENGRELGPGHAAHAEIRALGMGRYSHWGAQIYFSSSDNTDPRTNGRRYTVRERRR